MYFIQRIKIFLTGVNPSFWIMFWGFMCILIIIIAGITDSNNWLEKENLKKLDQKKAREVYEKLILKETQAYLNDGWYPMNNGQIRCLTEPSGTKCIINESARRDLDTFK